MAIPVLSVICRLLPGPAIEAHARASRQLMLTAGEKAPELAEGAVSNDPEIGLRAVAAPRVPM
jgi:hypothetical protein